MMYQQSYRAYYGHSKQEFTSFRGDVLNWSWIDHLNERYRLLRMQVEGKDVGHVSDYLKSKGVDIE